jgi:hypothetical protein
VAEPTTKASQPAKRAAKPERKGGPKRAYEAKFQLRNGSPAAIAVEEARQAGWLEGGHSQHVSFRAPKALVEAAMREAGAASPTEFGLAALALLAQPDPLAAYFKESFGRLGADFDLAY